jgi:hypothetical protein
VRYLRRLQEIAVQTGTPAPATLDRKARSSWPSSIVAKAAEEQGPQIAEWILYRMRETVFVDGRPADTEERALAAANQVPGVDPYRLAGAARDASTLDAVRRDYAETRAPIPEAFTTDAIKELDDGGHRYGLPTLLFELGSTRKVVEGCLGLPDYLGAAGM